MKINIVETRLSEAMPPRLMARLGQGSSVYESADDCYIRDCLSCMKQK